MEITFDERADAAYIYLTDMGADGVRTVPVDPSAVNGEINLDFGRDGRIVGIEVLEASRLLSMDLMAMVQCASRTKFDPDHPV